jgi:hypothetical protein
MAVKQVITPTGQAAKPKNKFDARYYLASFLQQLHDEGVPLMDVLVEVSATWYFAHHNPRRLPDGDALTWALARAAIYCAELPFAGKRWHCPPTRLPMASDQMQRIGKKPGAGPCRLLGTRLRRTLGVFFIHLTEVLDKQREQQILREQERRRALAAPLPQE